MTNRARVAALLAGCMALLAGLPTANAHGAPSVRELDVRVLLDDDGAIAYGGCTAFGCNPAMPADGLDLLALDVREAWLGDQPAFVFRLLFQTEATRGDRGLALELSVAGQLHEFLLESPDGIQYTSTSFARVDGPFDVGDGHPKALDAWVTAQKLAVAPGATLDAIAVASTLEGELDDVMPGGWYSGGSEVPHVPHDPAEGTAAQTPGTYAVKGPAALLTLEPTATVIDLARDGNVTLQVGNALAGTPQFTNLSLVLPPGVQASFDGAGTTQLNLDPAATRQVTLSFAPGSSGGNVTVVAESDLGARAQSVLQVVATPQTPADPPTPPTPAKDSPAPLLPIAVLLAALAALRRRGTDLTTTSPAEGQA